MSSPDESASVPESPNLQPTATGYEILDELARSGLGAVYRARDVMFDRELAIKVLHPGADPERLLAEARITAQLPHPGIPPVYSFGQLPDGRSFLAMKLVKGCTLDELLQERGSRTPDNPRFLAVFEQVCQTIAYAHVREVIHRDLKPANVVIGAFGEVLVMGWGLARVMAPNEPPSPGGLVYVVGTPLYMPPEQARGETADTRSDVFGLGGLLCIILTSEPTFVGGNVRDLLQRSAAGDLVDTFARLDVCGADPELIALAKRCLAPKREDRPADAGEVARAVTELRAMADERARRAELDRVRTAEQRKRSRTRAMMFAFAVVALGLLLINAILLVLRF